jgi:hypothetical protein
MSGEGHSFDTLFMVQTAHAIREEKKAEKNDPSGE